MKVTAPDGKVHDISYYVVRTTCGLPLDKTMPCSQLLKLTCEGCIRKLDEVSMLNEDDYDDSNFVEEDSDYTRDVRGGWRLE